MRFPRVGALVVVASLAVVACGGSTTPTSATVTKAPGAAVTPAGVVTPTPAGVQATPVAPAGGATLSPADSAAELCGLLTPADLKTTMSADYGAGVADQYGLCTFEVGGGSTNSGKGQVTLAILYNDLNLVKTSFSSGSAASVSGHNGWWDGDQGLQSLWVDIGGGALLVVSLDPITNDSQAAAQALATLIISKM